MDSTSIKLNEANGCDDMKKRLMKFKCLINLFHYQRTGEYLRCKDCVYKGWCNK